MQKILNKKTCEVIPYYYCLIYKTISEESNVTFSRHSNIVQPYNTKASLCRRKGIIIIAGKHVRAIRKC